MVDRTAFTAADVVADIWRHLELPPSALSSLSLHGSSEVLSSTREKEKPAVPSSFKIGVLAQSAVALSALGAAVVHSVRTGLLGTTTSDEDLQPDREVYGGVGVGVGVSVPRVTVPLRHAVLEFLCERLYTLDGRPPAQTWGPIGGLYPTADHGGYVRIHDNFPHHRRGALSLLGLEPTCVDRKAVAERTRMWESADLERVAVEEKGLAVYKLRSYDEWDALPQARALRDFLVDRKRRE
ncbi:hypothetical protein NPX13_g8808 [Xylaria arbuscula]|uniref:Uncharacterized protein n=1 Tax=Xylaria arbuscula TaxID=114810 RepID=A0A9W8TJ42_9PEZI|nr:hypothetical protein NPX13_g8808 [Xylaria arbuscula]